MNSVVNDLTRKVNYNYFVINKYEAGIVLFGYEAKSIRLNGIDLSTSFVYITNKFDAYLSSSVINFNSFVFSFYNINDRRDIKLLLKKKELKLLDSFLKRKGYTLVPSKAYWKNSYLKLELCLCLGKKIYDKRECLKKIEFKRHLNEKLKF